MKEVKGIKGTLLLTSTDWSIEPFNHSTPEANTMLTMQDFLKNKFKKTIVMGAGKTIHMKQLSYKLNIIKCQS